MSMSEDTENFEQLRRLLALKRHEQPPPGYFSHFSRQVIGRIQAGERGEEAAVLDWLSWEAPWLQRIWAALETKPILAGAFGVALCGLMVAGALYSDKGDVASGALAPSIDAVSMPLAQMSMPTVDHPLLAKPVGLVPSSSTDPINTSQTDDLLLGALRKLRAEPASISFPGSN
jgi:hypothetical protein